MYTAVMNNSLIDSKCISELLECGILDTYKDIFELIQSDKDISDISDKSAFKIKDARDHVNDLTETYTRYEKIIRKCGIKVISTDSGYYPAIWKGLTGMPRVLFLRGNETALKKLDEMGAVSIVGSRDAGRYSLYATGEFTSRLASKGIVIVSGMALGIDRAAHKAAMDSGGVTVAVMPCGCDQIYPFQNADIYNRMISTGSAVVSEMPPESSVKKQYFPSRNRLISALSDCCLIMEAGEYSGTLHTASFAAYQGRDVYVLPNNIYADNCTGGLKLINDGAFILLDEKDVIDSVAERLLYRKIDSQILTDSEKKLVELETIRRKIDKTPEDVCDNDVAVVVEDELSVRSLTADEICSKLKLPFYRVSQILSEMELNGRVCIEKGKYALTMLH